MKIHAEREALVDVAQAVSRFVSQRSPLPVLAGIRITAGDGDVVFDATDLELYLSVRTDFNVEDPGVVVVPGRLFGDISEAFRLVGSRSMTAPRKGACRSVPVRASSP